MKLDGTAAIVTGAASGLGSATASALAKAGAQVYGLDVQDSHERGDGVKILSADVSDPGDVASALGQVRKDGRALRLVVNCAGIAPSIRTVSRSGPHDLELFDRVLRVNLLGTFNVLRLAAEAMSTLEPDSHGQRGLIVNTASIAAYEPQVGQVAYAASKAGVVGLTLATARDLAQFGIRVMTIAPGLVATPMMEGFSDDVQANLASAVTFPKRLAEPTEFAQLVMAIATNDYLNGEVIRMDGALRMAAR